MKLNPSNFANENFKKNWRPGTNGKTGRIRKAKRIGKIKI